MAMCDSRRVPPAGHPSMFLATVAFCLVGGVRKLLGVALHAAFAVDRGEYQGTPLLAVLLRWEAGAPKV